MNHSKKALTLVEILMVVIILSILAVVVVPQFTDASEESKLTTLKANLHLIRTQVELYKLHHNGEPPTDINTQLTNRTDADGTINPLGACGPYLHVFPDNPFVADPIKAIETDGLVGVGWKYDAVQGVIIPNTPGHVNLQLVITP